MPQAKMLCFPKIFPLEQGEEVVEVEVGVVGVVGVVAVVEVVEVGVVEGEEGEDPDPRVPAHTKLPGILPWSGICVWAGWPWPAEAPVPADGSAPHPICWEGSAHLPASGLWTEPELFR